MFGLNASFFYYLEKRTANDDFQLDLFPRNLPLSAIYHKTAWSDLPEPFGEKIHTLRKASTHLKDSNQLDLNQTLSDCV
ncbi:hypothetical protein TNCV_2768811 [Trichonephila clavipes]|nr:hypothetical protein TNCV_2768811 [Trichonephila clavipes]